MTVSLDDRQALVRYLRRYCAGRENRMKQPALARALGWSVRDLQAVWSEEAQHNGHLGTSSGRYAGCWWSETDADARVAKSNVAGRIGPLARRMRAIERAFPTVSMDRLLDI